MADPQPGRSNEFTPGDEHDRWAREEWDRIWSRGFGGKQKREAGRATRKLLADLRRRATPPEDKTLREALKPFAALAGTSTVQTAAQKGHVLTITNGDRMCAIEAEAFIRARAALSHGEDDNGK